jgi:probable addiction module antidote protein
MRLLWFAEVNPNDAGRIAGQAFVWIALLAGALKCWSISRRPTTNTKCALALMLVLLGFVVAASVGVLMQNAGTSPAMVAIRGLLALMMLGLMVTAIVLAILGLIEFPRPPRVFVQGRAQAIWALALAGVMGLMAVAGFVSAILRSSSPSARAGQTRPLKRATSTGRNICGNNGWNLTNMRLKNYREDLLERLKDADYAAEYLVQVLAEKDRAAFLVALRDVVEATGGMSVMAKRVGLTRPSLYKVFSKKGNPTLETLQAILEALGLRVTVTTAKTA